MDSERAFVARSVLDFGKDQKSEFAIVECSGTSTSTASPSAVAVRTSAMMTHVMFTLFNAELSHWFSFTKTITI